MPETILVTGANGFIGRYLCHKLQAAGYKVVAALRSEQTGPWDEVRLADFSGEIDKDLAQGIDAIFHLASVVHARGTSETVYQSVNVNGTRQLLASGKLHSVSQFIYFSSIKVMGETTTTCVDEQLPPSPVTLYGQSKWEAEKLVLNEATFHQRINLRLAPVFGHGMSGSLLRLQKAMRFKFFPQFPRVNNQRSFVSVDDVINACMSILASEQDRVGCYFLAERSAYDIADLQAMMRSEPSWIYLPLWCWKLAALSGDMAAKLLGRPMPFDSLQYDALFANACYRSDLFSRHFDYQFTSALTSFLQGKQ